MAENGETLGVRAEIDAADVRKGAEEFIRAIEDMAKAAGSGAGKMNDSVSVMLKQLSTLGEAADAIRVKLAAISSATANAVPKDAGAAKEIAAVGAAADTLGRSCEAMQTRIAVGAAELREQGKAAQGASASLREYGSTADSAGKAAQGAAGANAKARMKELAEEVKFASGEIEKMTARYAELEDRLARLNTKKADLSQQPVSADPLSRGARDYKVQTNNSQIAETEAEMRRIKEITAEYKGEIASCNSEMAALSQQTGGAGQKSVTLRTELRNARQAVAALQMAGKENTAEFGRAVEAANKLQAAFKKSTMAVNGKGLAFNSFEAISTAVNGATGALTTYMGVAGLFVKDQEELMEVQKNLQAVMSISMGVQQMMNAATQISVKWNALKATALQAVTAAEAGSAAGATASAAANTANTGAAVASTAANWTLAASFRAVGVAIKSIPLIGWALAAIAAVVAAVTAVVRGVQKAAAESKEIREAEKREQERLAAEQKALADEARKYAASKVKGMNDEIADSAGKLIAKYKELRSEWGQLGGSVSKQNVFIKEHKSDFDALGVSINGSVEANDFFINQTDSFVESCKLRARAIAAIHLAEKNEQKNLELELDSGDRRTTTRDVRFRQHFGDGDRVKDATFEDVKKGFHAAGQGKVFDEKWASVESGYAGDSEKLQRLKNLWVEKLTKNGGSIGEGKNKLTADSNTLSKIDRERAYRQKKSSDAQRIAANNKQIQENNKENEKLYETARESEKKAGNLNKYQAPAKGGSKGGGKGGSGKTDAERKYEAQQRYDNLILEEQESFAEKSDKLAQLRLDQMEESATKQVAQIRKDKQDQLDELDEWINGLAQKRKEMARDNWVGAKDGRTEQQWAQTPEGKRTDEDWVKELFAKNEELKTLKEQLQAEITKAADSAEEKAVDEILEKYSGDTDRKERIKELKTDIAALEEIIKEYEKKGDKARATELKGVQDGAKADLKWISCKRDVWNKFLSEYGTVVERKKALDEAFEHDTAGMDENSPEYLTKKEEYDKQSGEMYADEKWEKFSYMDYFSDWSKFAEETLVEVESELRNILELDEQLDGNGRNKLHEKYEKVKDALDSKQEGGGRANFGGLFGLIGSKRQEKDDKKKEKAYWEQEQKFAKKNLEIAQKEYDTKKKAYDDADKGFIDGLKGLGNEELDKYMEGKSTEELAKEATSDGGGALGQISGVGDKIEQIRGLAQNFQGAQGQLQGAATNLQGAGAQMQAANAGAAGAGGGGGGAGGVAMVDKIVNGINDNVQSLGTLMEEFGVNMENPDHNQNVEGLKSFMKASQSAADGWNSFKSGDMIGAAAGVVGSLTNLYDSFRHFFGVKSSMEEYIEAKEKYDKLAEVWDTLISRKQEYMDISWGTEAKKAGEEAVKLAKSQEDNTREIAKKYNAAWEKKNHSAGHKFEEKMSGNDWEVLASVTGVDFSSHDSSKLYDLTSEQIEALMTNAQDVWVKLDDKQREYLEKIMESKDTINDTADAVKEKLTGFSFTSLYEDFTSTLQDMESAADDFSDSFQENLYAAVIGNKLGEKYKTQLEKLSEKAEELRKKDGGTLSARSVAELEKAYNAITSAANQDRENMEAAYGWDSESLKEQSKNGYATASEDSVEELSGRMLASNEALYSIRDAVANIPAALTQVVTIEAGRNEWYTESLEIQQTSVSHLAAIERNTNELYGMNEKLDKIERNTRNI